ncbi:kynurenine/alpha-aminoadipate aminotransferase, mitochondrial-like [Ischnura elegans]|uniref:kynurenine/alpha-aminoadipate aminotransferase, mitochondrial-like n=1 Tax=Ischnura elegans TaxID=197161 RepID=UPI001ED8AF50|nr:kynurenine/alpha-aminoadipate aminotransferase, mitochondrial-like [Ischnura elegans]
MSRFICYRTVRKCSVNSFSSYTNLAAMSTQTSKVPLDYNRFLNDVSIRRKPSKIREITALFASAPSGTVFFAGGFPNPETFPFAETKFTLKDGTTFTLTGKALEAALQYQPTPGYPAMRKQLFEIMKKTHNPPNWDNYDIIVTSGSQDGLSKAFEMSLEEGEPVIVQDPIYTGALGILKPLNPQFICIPEDENGMQPDKLRKALEACFKGKSVNDRKGVPKVMYINPTGGNPTGTVLLLERKKEIYQLACKYNLLILEDDPYYHLHFLDENPQSFLSMDTEGRVLRFDSYSKILSSGLRMGFVSGPKPLVKRIELHMQVASLHASSLSQVIISNLLELWKTDKFEEHVKSVQKYYKSKRDMMIRAAEKHLTGLAEWTVPKAGMFLWIKVNGIKDVNEMVTVRAVKRNVLIVPGHVFMADASKPCQYVRLSYSMPTEEEINRGMENFAQLIKEELSLQK